MNSAHTAPLHIAAYSLFPMGMPAYFHFHPHLPHRIGRLKPHKEGPHATPVYFTVGEKDPTTGAFLEGQSKVTPVPPQVGRTSSFRSQTKAIPRPSSGPPTTVGQPG